MVYRFWHFWFFWHAAACSPASRVIRSASCQVRKQSKSRFHLNKFLVCVSCASCSLGSFLERHIGVEVSLPTVPRGKGSSLISRKALGYHPWNGRRGQASCPGGGSAADWLRIRFLTIFLLLLCCSLWSIWRTPSAPELLDRIRTRSRYRLLPIFKPGCRNCCLCPMLTSSGLFWWMCFSQVKLAFPQLWELEQR